MFRNLAKKIWHDPVGSAVIAGIILGLPTMVTYLTSLNTQNSLLIFGAGIVVFILCLTGFLYYHKMHGIILNTKTGIISAACTNDRIDYVTNFLFHGKNKSSKKPIPNVSGKLQSNLTNEIFPIYFNLNGNLVSPKDTNGIPAGANFELVVPFVKDDNNEFIKGEDGRWNPNQGIGLGDFLSNLEASTLTLELDGEIYFYSISPEVIRQNISSIQRMISPPIEPKITQRKQKQMK
jgi:hypothetical protein